jgi:hypothetical protein
MNYQIAQANQQISNYNDAGQTYKIYDETLGVNPDPLQPNATNEAIGYIIGALQAGIPVVVDCRAGTTSPSNDNTTDHFVTIVGMGYNPNEGNFFKYYDCSTYSISQGARASNKLRLLSTGRFEGQFPTIYANTAGFYPYRITQVRRSMPL